MSSTSSFSIFSSIRDSGAASGMRGWYRIGGGHSVGSHALACQAIAAGQLASA
jgi:hypothetical protein